MAMWDFSGGKQRERVTSPPTSRWALMLQFCVRPSVCLSVVCFFVTYVLWLYDVSWSKSYYWQPMGSRIC